MASFLRQVLDLDTLDTRFSTPTSVPYKTIIDARGDSTTGGDKTGPDGQLSQQQHLQQQQQQRQLPSAAKTSPPRWKTPEFCFYCVVFVAAVPYMFWVAYDVSRPSDPRYPKFEHLLSPGWIPGRKVDVSDSQYHSFRQNLPYMALLLIVHPICRRLWNAVFPLPATPVPASAVVAGKKTSSPAEAAANARLNQRVSFDYAFAIVYLVALHGVSAAKVLAILALNYQLATKLPPRYVPWATWAFNVGTLFANELCNGYRFSSVALVLTGGRPLPGAGAGSEAPLVRLGEWLDGYGGIMARWEILFNITVLRLISFNLDYYWSIDRKASVSLELDPANLCERDRISIPAAPEDYSFRNYVAYAIYAPLYLTGPIITFNDYVAQGRHRPASIERTRTLRYAARFALVLLAMELVLHFDYVGAISLAGPDWASYSPAQLIMLSYFKLHIIWLKLLLPWRFFRLWSLADGVDPPENMVRCVSNNYSTLSFWRGWHRSFYRWTLRYLYIPLGGVGGGFGTASTALRSVASYLCVFTFVALWHDIQLRLLVWGWLIVFFFLPEIIASRVLFPRRRWDAHAGEPGTAYRMLSGAGAIANVLMMMAANLVGFAVGVEGLRAIVQGVLDSFSGVLFVAGSCAAIFVGIQVMFEIRESELRRGINMKC